MQRRRTILLLLIFGIVALGALLFLNIQQSRLFKVNAPGPNQAVQTDVSGTQLGVVSASTLLELPRYTGQDNQGRRWEVTAASAGQQGSSTSTTILLNDVAASLELPATATDPSQTIKLSAKNGAYQQSANLLKLTENVLVEGLGLTLEAEQIDADLTSRELEASGGTVITGKISGWNITATAPLMKVQKNNNQLTLTGGVHATLVPTH